VGIIAAVCSLLAEHGVNILDISQTILRDYFTMVMLVDTALCNMTFEELGAALQQKGEDSALSIRIQREDIFTAMHRI
jgi:ACT domain-containing protein